MRLGNGWVRPHLRGDSEGTHHVNVKGLLEALIAAQVQKTVAGKVASSGAGGIIGGLSRMLATRAGSAIAGVLVSTVLNSKGGKGLGGSLGRLGGLAAIGTLAWQAYQSWQSQQPPGGQPQPGARPSPVAAPEAPPPGSPLAPETEEGEEELSRILIRAMIAAAKADGHIDEKEGAAIGVELGKMELAEADRAFVMAEIEAPLDVARVARGVAGNPQLATAVYAASLLAITVDTAAERDYLASLAQRLDLDPALVASLREKIQQGALTA